MATYATDRGPSELLRTMCDSLRRQLTDAIDLFRGDVTAAEAHVRERTTAGPRVWQIVRRELGIASAEDAAGR